MILDYLGHSEFIATLKNKSGKDVTILSDTWLSDHIVGDLMGRNPTFSLDYSVLTQIDAIFISHAHTDHLDPYTLVGLYKNLASKPILLIPETLTFLKSTFEEFLPEAKIITMRNKEKYDINGVTVRGYIFENEGLTNEDDVMSLFISNDTEIVYTEVDTVPPSNENTQNYLYKIFTERNYESVVYLATRNELE
jgi:L-ascorbate metabolism protein UlaG (beta-lactamase superfamily)